MLKELIYDANHFKHHFSMTSIIYNHIENDLNIILYHNFLLTYSGPHGQGLMAKGLMAKGLMAKGLMAKGLMARVSWPGSHGQGLMARASWPGPHGQGAQQLKKIVPSTNKSICRK